MLLREPTAVRDFYDAQEVRAVYYPEVEALVGRLLGAEKVLVFGEVARSDSATTGDGQRPAYGAHVDYGERTVRQFTRDLLGPARGRPLVATQVRPDERVAAHSPGVPHPSRAVRCLHGEAQ